LFTYYSNRNGQNRKSLKENERGITTVNNTHDIVTGILIVTAKLGIAPEKVNGIAKVIPRTVIANGMRIVMSWHGMVKKLPNPLAMMKWPRTELIIELRKDISERKIMLNFQASIK